MSDPDPKRQMSDLEQRIAAAKKGQGPKPRGDEHYSAANLAWRMVIELVAGLGIGFGMGYGLDALFGTTPFLMLVFTLLGLAAGIKTMMRTSAEFGGNTAAGDAPADREGGRDGD
ncbi:ATP synthase F0, subunit I [Pseudooceanicola batsensis HTCC2597]|uniref:ATP synthase protein I n=1 Tax=Pseudooceanicola batsensis (strain ATCC BAA-863 / DSM 15984 / KCTC 12145 / HTCC2597) TaxID=252305 RepID=A3TVJ4_PSEBH|nr:AtpZ/AtpI family protein [Pseudooceanicola batsensis]EAQ03640.1 ATP synthase F0, subunit I [Pseudooceanicola batsensis HTCC2597]